MNTDLFDITDRIVVVTGAFGQLGRQFCQSLLARGARVAALDMRLDPGLATQIGAPDDRLLMLEADVTAKASLETALTKIHAHWGVPQALINNAGLDSPPNSPAEENGPFETYPEASFDRVMDVNTKGVLLCCQVFGGAMAAVGRGSIVNICSIYGLVSPNQTLYDYRRTEGQSFYKPVAYSVSKSALLNLTRYLATYWARAGVRVNTLTFAGVFNNQDPRFLDKYQAHIPIGRMAREDEYNGAVIFLTSDASSYMTGSNMIIDGGWTAW